MSYKIAIPSYKRAETLKSKTLNVLLNSNVDLTCVTIFVADEDEYKIYSKAIPDIKVVIGKPTLRGARNFISEYYPEGDCVLNLDDDISEIGIMLNEKDYTSDIDLHKLITTGFGLALKNKIRLWGIYPLLNPFYMDKLVSYDLKYIVGAFWGVVNTHDKSLQVSLEDKEDYERTLLFYEHDGAVLRLNYVGVKTNYYKEAGGMQETRTEQRVTQSAYNLLKRFPHYCKLNTAKKSKHTEIRLRDSIKRI